MAKRAPKPASRPEGVSWFKHIKLFREDMLSSQPDRLYRAWMAETRGPFYRSFLVNDPQQVKRVLVDEQPGFPKSTIISNTLASLLGRSVFVTNGPDWERQRRIIDPAFEGSLKSSFPAMLAASDAAVERLAKLANGNVVEIEFLTSYLTADVIFRTLFSIPITSAIAEQVFDAFRIYQRAQPLWNLPDLLRWPLWIPRFRSAASRHSAAEIRTLLEQLVKTRAQEIKAGTAPDDLATRIMTTIDPESGAAFTPAEMVDQVVIFFLAGHETSASALAWSLYLLADNPSAQDRIAAEVAGDVPPEFEDIAKFRYTRDVFRETLRLYPPVPMMVREAAKDTEMRGRKVAKGSLIIVSPWHLQRHERLWQKPDEFDPDRWQRVENKTCQIDAYLPFSKGPRVCTGAGFAMVEGVLLLSMLIRYFHFETTEETPIPVAHLTVRAKDGIKLRVSARVPDTRSEHIL